MNKKEIKTSILSLVRKALLGLSVICFIACSAYLIKNYVIEPYKNKTASETPSCKVQRAFGKERGFCRNPQNSAPRQG